MKKAQLKTTPTNRVLSKRFRKIDDPNYSLFDQEYNAYKSMRRILLSMITVGAIFFIPGLILTIYGFIAVGVPLLSFGALGLMITIYLPIQLKDRAKFSTILHLKETKNQSQLLQLAQRYSLSYGLLDQEKAQLATYVLIDMKSQDIALLLKDRLSHRKPRGVRQILSAFYLLAIKLGYNDHIELYNAIETGSILGKKTEPAKAIVDMDVVVPITKVYFLEEIPERAKCMVSGLEIDFNIDEVVVCPYCSAFAKKDLLSAWLLEKQSCPVCQRSLKIVDCPAVRFGTKGKI